MPTSRSRYCRRCRNRISRRTRLCRICGKLNLKPTDYLVAAALLVAAWFFLWR